MAMARFQNCKVQVDALRRFRPLFELIHGDFLLPTNYPGHSHKWRELDAGFCLCELCGAEHVCFAGDCPLTETDASEKVCTISGCVIVQSEMLPEREALDRVAVFIRPSARRRRGAPPDRAPHQHLVPEPRSAPQRLRCVNDMDVNDFVELVVRELLDSRRTRQCECQELARDHGRRMSALGRLVREAAAPRTGAPPGELDVSDRVNLVELEARLAWQCRKCRPMPRWSRDTVDRVVRVCVGSISTLLVNFGWQRVARQLQHATRGREFVCSMLYLMRVGITYRNRCLLLRLDALHDMLPLQVFLPQVFRIRAKSITEGENIIKLDIRRMPA